MRIATCPRVDDGQPGVEFHVGELAAHLTASQAEEIAESLARAATASRYESAIREMLAGMGHNRMQQEDGIAQVRLLIERRRTAKN